MIGERFGSLTVRGLMNRNIGGIRPDQAFACQCDCGVFAIASEPQLREGRVGGCNCVGCEHDATAKAARLQRAARQLEREHRGQGATRAHEKVKRAVKSGVLVRPATCSRCGETGRIVAHHDSYDRPLDVMWLCDERCHGARHRELVEMTAASVSIGHEGTVHGAMSAGETR